MALSGLVGPGQIIRPRSITIVRTDPIPDLPKSAGAAARLAAAIRAISLVATDIPHEDKWKADAVTSQEHSKELSLTDHPVETGFRITDHSRRMPDVLVFTGIVSDTPTTLLGSAIGQAQALSFKSRSQAEYQRLIEIFKAREPVFVATSLEVYPSMILKSLVTMRDEDTGAAVGVNLMFREVQIREGTLAGALLDDDALFLGAGPGTNGGTLPLVPA